jgi:AraC-like DNA-binding protein
MAAAARDTRGPHEVVFESSDPDSTEAYLTHAFRNPVRIHCDRDKFRYRLVRLHSGPFDFSTVDHSATTDYQADRPPALAVLRMLRGTHTDVDINKRLGPGDLSLHGQPGQPFHTQATEAWYTVLFVPTQVIADAARNRPEDEPGPLRFDFLRPAHPAAALRWQHTISYVIESVRANPETMTQPLLSGATMRLLAATVLTTFPSTWTTDTHAQDRVDATPTTLARATAFIDANADIDITLVDIARAAYVTVRAVQLAFRRHLDTTPTAYLRRVRLQRAHQELGAANPNDGTTIRAVAERWGFPDPSRFAALYRRTYGQPPSQTLRT